MLERLEILVGKENVNKIKSKNIAVIGIGGVGGYVVESLVRSGVENITIIDYDKIDGSLVIRSPQAEDFFYFNDKNRKFVKDYMVNEKIPKADREKQLLLADGSHMVYFLGRRISNYYKVTEDTRHILEITVTGG